MAVELLEDQKYYETPELWGQAQYVTLKNVIDNIMVTASEDSLFKHAKEHYLSIHGKQGIKRFNLDIKQENRAIRIQLGPELIFPFPRFMTDWARVSVVNQCDNLHVLEVNDTPTVHDYLQDHNWELLYDDEGRILRGHDRNHERGYCCYQVECSELETTCPDLEFEDSWVKKNKEGGYFEFSPDLYDKIIVIEFMSAGLDDLADCEVLIHHNLELTVTNWIKWKLLEGQRNVPLSTVQYWQSQYKVEKRRSSALMGTKISLEQIVKSVGLRFQN